MGYRQARQVFEVPYEANAVFGWMVTILESEGFEIVDPHPVLRAFIGYRSRFWFQDRAPVRVDPAGENRARLEIELGPLYRPMMWGESLYRRQIDRVIDRLMDELAGRDPSRDASAEGRVAETD